MLPTEGERPTSIPGAGLTREDPRLDRSIPIVVGGLLVVVPNVLVVRLLEEERVVRVSETERVRKEPEPRLLEDRDPKLELRPELRLDEPNERERLELEEPIERPREEEEKPLREEPALEPRDPLRCP